MGVHNQFIPSHENDYLNEKSNKSIGLLGNKGNKNKKNKNNKNMFDYSSGSDDDHINKKHKYPQPIIKKPKVTNHAEIMWQNKWKESQKEVEKWQAKYNDLYLKYKDLLKEKETWQKHPNDTNEQNMDLLSGDADATQNHNTK